MGNRNLPEVTVSHPLEQAVLSVAADQKGRPDGCTVDTVVPRVMGQAQVLGLPESEVRSYVTSVLEGI